MSWGNYQQHYSGHPPPQGYGGVPHQSVPPQNGAYQHYQGVPQGYHQAQPYGNNYGRGPPPSGPPPGGLPPGYGPPPGGPPPSGLPPGYGPPRENYPPAGPPPGIDQTLWEWFRSVDADKSGQISAMELREALVNSNWSHFNEETCRLLIGMFDKDSNGTIDIYEFGALWKYVQDWKGCFDRFDADKSGNISSDELQTALSTFGYRLSINFCRLCTRLFDRSDQNSMKFDDFIQCCVMLRSLTESFKRLDTDKDGVIDVSYEQVQYNLFTLYCAFDNETMKVLNQLRKDFLEMAIDNTIIH